MERIRRACAATARETLLKTVDGFERRLRFVFKPENLKRERQGELTTRKHLKGNRTYYVHAVVSS